MASKGALTLTFDRHLPVIRFEPGSSFPQTASSIKHRRNSLCCLLTMMLIAAATTTAMAAEPPPTRVAVTKVFEKEIAPTTPLVGIVAFDQSAGISPEVSGLIADHRMIEGTVVRNGDILARLNTDFIAKDIEVLNQQMAQVDIRIENALKNLGRFETLFKQDAATEKNFDDLAFEAKDLKIEKERLRVTLNKKKLELEKSIIRAPFNGLVLKRMISQGEWVSPGDPICQLAALDDLVVQVAVSEDLMPFVKVGQNVTLSVTAMGRELQGRVKIVVPNVDMKSKTFDVKISIDYIPGLFQNMSARVNIPAGPVRRLKMIKRGALVRFQGKEFVYTVKEGQAKILPVKVSALDGDYLGVDDASIAAGMPVVVDGNERLRPDQAVTVVDNPGKESEQQESGNQ